MLALLAFLRSLFGEASLPGTEPDEHERPPVKKRIRLAIVVGHNTKRQGAYSPALGSEYAFNGGEVVDAIMYAARGSSVEVAVFRRSAGAGGYSAEMRDLSKRVNAWKPDCAVSLHFNSFRTSTANGTETLHTGSKRGAALADLAQRCMLDCFGLNNRGLRKVGRGGRGAGFLYGVKAPAVLLEPGFGSNATDAASLKKNWPEFADDLIWLVQKWRT